MSLTHKIRSTAIIAILLYTILRFFIVKTVLENYGVNPWIFLLLDASTGIVYILGIERLVRALRSKKKRTSLRSTSAWATATAFAFVAPYAYLYASGQKMPLGVSVGLALIIFLLLLNAIVAFRRRMQT